MRQFHVHLISDSTGETVSIVARAAIAHFEAVEAVEVLGVKTNAGFLARTLRRPEFMRGAVDTGFIAQHIDALSDTARQIEAAAPIAAALSLDIREERALGRAVAAGEDNSPWSRMDGFRVNLRPRLGVSFLIDDERREIPVTASEDGYFWRHGEDETPIWIDRDEEWFEGQVGDEPVQGRVLETEEGLILLYRGESLRFVSPRAKVEDAAEAEGQIEAPMPGKVLEVRVKEGDSVTKGQTLVILEAMKMEQSLTAPRDGVVESVSAEAGEQVSEGQILVALAEETEEAA